MNNISLKIYSQLGKTSQIVSTKEFEQMALKDSIKTMNVLLSAITKDLVKAEKGNKAASQRVRTNSIKLEKNAKKYRKESVAEEKKRVKTAKPAKKAQKKKVAPKKGSKKK